MVLEIQAVGIEGKRRRERVQHCPIQFKWKFTHRTGLLNLDMK